MSFSREREEREKKAQASKTSLFLSFVFFVIIVVAAYFASGWMMDQMNFYRELGVPREVPAWAIQLVLGAIVFFVLRLLFVLVVGWLGGGKEEPISYDSLQNPWER
jgi:uncharacterized membrane protein